MKSNKSKEPEDRKHIQNIISILEKQNMYIVQEMNDGDSINAMLDDSRVRINMSEYQTLSWSIVVILGIGLIAHFGKK